MRTNGEKLGVKDDGLLSIRKWQFGEKVRGHENNRYTLLFYIFLSKQKEKKGYSSKCIIIYIYIYIFFNLLMSSFHFFFLSKPGR